MVDFLRLLVTLIAFGVAFFGAWAIVVALLAQF